MKLVRKKRFLLLSLVVLFFTCAHLLLKYRSQQVFSAVVDRFTKGGFGVETKDVDISYFPLGVEIRGLRLLPASRESGLQQLDCELLRLRIESVSEFLLHRNLDVEEFVAIKPYVRVKAIHNGRTSANKARASLKALQSQLFDLFDLLKAERIRLEDCAFRLDQGDGPDDYFSINRFSLALDDFHLEKGRGNVTDPFHGEASLSLIRPQIHLADTNVSIGVNELTLDKSSQTLSIDSLHILVRDEEMQYEGIRLASVAVKNLNWSRFLEEGRVEIDSAEVLSGTASLNLSKSEKEGRRSRVNRKKYEGSPVLIHHVSVKDISYSLLTKDYMGKKDNKVLFAIQGEKFEVGELELDPDKHPAISAKEIDLRLKDYSENDADESYSVSMGAVKFNDGDLTLRDYLLKPKKGNVSNKVSVPELRVEGLSLEELLMRRVDARRLVVLTPEVVVDVKKRGPSGKRNETPDESLRRLLGGLQDRVAVGSIVIDNGSLRLRSADSTGQDVVISGVALRFSGNEALKSRSINEAIRSIDEFRTGAFTIKGPSTDLSVDRLHWLPGKSGLRFDHVTGKLGLNTVVDFSGMEVDLKAPVIGNGGVLDASMLRVDSGRITVQGPFNGKKNRGPAPFFRADKVQLDNIDVAYMMEKRLIASSRISIAIDDLGFDRQKRLWSRIYLSGIRNLFQGGETRIEAEEISATQPGAVSFIGVNGRYVSAGKSIGFRAEEFRIDGGLQDGTLSAAAVHSVFLQHPTIEANIDLRANGSLKEKKKTEGLLLPTITHLEMNGPKFQLVIIDSTGKTITRSRTLNGTLSLDSVRMVSKGDGQRLLASKLHYATDHVSGEWMEQLFEPARLQVDASMLDYGINDKSMHAKLDRLRIEDFHHVFVDDKKDSVSVSGKSLEAFDWMIGGEEKADWKSMLSANRWNAEGIDIVKRTGKGSINVAGLFIRHDADYRFGFDRLHLVTSDSRESFWSDHPFEKDFITMELKMVDCPAAKVDLSGKSPSFHTPYISIGSLSLRPERDKTRLEDTVAYRPLLCRQLESIPMDFSIDSLHLADGQLEYHEIGQRTGKEGLLALSRLNGYALNLRNRGLEETDSLFIRMSGALYDQALFRVNFRQSYRDSLQGFWMRIRLSSFDMAKMNALLLPLMRIELRSGRIDTMTILVKGNDHFAFGTIDMRYDDLYVGLGSDGGKRKMMNRLADWAANFYIRNSDNGKPNILFRRRIKKRGQFNYWGKIAVEGLLSDIGIKWDDAERRAFEKAIRSYELPVDYWSEE